jgi:hypothetical protein
MTARTAVALVAGVVLLLAAWFAFLAWAFGGLTGLLGVVAPSVVLLGLVWLVAAAVYRRGSSRPALIGLASRRSRSRSSRGVRPSRLTGRASSGSGPVASTRQSPVQPGSEP